MKRPAGAYSLRRRLLALLLAPLIVIGLVALIDSYREADRTADAVSDRVLAGSALAIAERVVVGENGRLEVDVPYVALEMLTSTAQDRVFYRVDGPDGRLVTGQPLGAGVITSHKPLKFGEFTDHFGDEIGLAQARGLFGEVGQLFLRPREGGDLSRLCGAA